MRFRILRGTHYPDVPKTGEGMGRCFSPKHIKDGNPHIIDTDINLVKELGRHRFELLHEDYKEVEDSDEFDTMTVAELRSFAAREEIDLGNLTKKSDLIELIREETASVA